jgi:hypothetical protein
MPTVVAPHPVPQSNRPILASGVVVAAALPLFLIAGWPLAGWGIATVLWIASQFVAVVLRRRPLGMGNLASSGTVAIGRMVRSITAMVVLLAVTVSNQRVGVSAVAVYALAFTAEFGTSLVAYYGGEAGS